jgi:ABC-type glycerol-3-phosphate transport system substrate-binding protein
MKLTVKRWVTGWMIAALACGILTPPPAVADTAETARATPADAARTRQDAASELLEKNYSDMLRDWADVPAVEGVRTVVAPAAQPANAHLLVPRQDSRGYASDTVRWNQGASVDIRVDVPAEGLYELAFDYFVLDESILAPEGYVLINGEYPFYESRRILFPNLWTHESEEYAVDRYGNELLPRPVKVRTWQTVSAMDASYFHMEPLRFPLKQGENTITLVNTRGDMLLGDVTVSSPSALDDYDAYLRRQSESGGTEQESGGGEDARTAEQGGKARNESASDRRIVIEAEKPLYKNDSSIRAASGTDSKLTPYHTRRKLLNIIDPGSFDEGGQSVTWRFEVPRSGYYRIAFKYKQEDQHQLPVFRRIAIDGGVPFRELDNYPFAYTKKWRNEILGDGREDYRIYLTEGEHTLTMTVNLSRMRPLAEEIARTMKEIGAMSLEIKKLTGNRRDPYRDWNLTEYIPDVAESLESMAERLEWHYRDLGQLNPDVKEIGAIANLKLAVRQLRSLSREPDELPDRMNMFSEGTSSVNQLLGTLLQNISLSPLSLDKIYVFQDEKLPAPNAGFFSNMWEHVKRFFLSFTPSGYSASAQTEGELQVWVNRPRAYVELMQEMIDEQFTRETGIPVKLSIMPDENKLILANAAGRQPDAALGVNNWIPYELAIRGAVLDLRQFDGYEEMIRKFAPGAVIPFAFEDGVYALPETQDFWVLFYRKDILDSLHLEPPDTWDDVVEMLPELQRLGMNFYEPISMYEGFKPFVATVPFIHQFGGELFDESGMNSAIDSEAALEGIRFMTDLFTIYNVPQSVPNFYHHFRYGTLPVGISNFATYIQLKAAAPEIANWWKIAPHPGVKKADGTVERWTPGGGQAGMIFKGTPYAEQAWKFLQWWMSTPVQVEFANLMQTSYGTTFMWNTANLEAVEQLPWPEDDKRVVLEQLRWIREASRVPGAYMVEREISDVWNRVVFDGDNPRSAIDDAVIRANREIRRKMEEFGYAINGVMIRPYPVPTITTVNRWVEAP